MYSADVLRDKGQDRPISLFLSRVNSLYLLICPYMNFWRLKLLFLLKFTGRLPLYYIAVGFDGHCSFKNLKWKGKSFINATRSIKKKIIY